jgi:hypothetical protein
MKYYIPFYGFDDELMGILEAPNLTKKNLEHDEENYYNVNPSEVRTFWVKDKSVVGIVWGNALPTTVLLTDEELIKDLL